MNGVIKSGVKVKKEFFDVLELCYTVLQEVVNLSMFLQFFMCIIDVYCKYIVFWGVDFN